MSRALAVAAVLAAAAGGCGGGASDEEKARTTLQEFWAAADRKDGEAMCARLDDGEQGRLEGAWETCEEGAVAIYSAWDTTGADPDVAKRLAKADYDVRIDGELATAEEPRAGCFLLRKVDGDWLLSELVCD